MIPPPWVVEICVVVVVVAGLVFQKVQSDALDRPFIERIALLVPIGHAAARIFNERDVLPVRLLDDSRKQMLLARTRVGASITGITRPAVARPAAARARE